MTTTPDDDDPTRRYAVHAAAGVTLNAGHVSDLGRGGGCIQPTTPFSTGAGPLPRVIPLVYDSFVASTSSALPRLCPGVPCASSNREYVLKKLCPKSPWVYTFSFAYGITPALIKRTHSLRPRRPARKYYAL